MQEQEEAGGEDRGENGTGKGKEKVMERGGVIQEGDRQRRYERCRSIQVGMGKRHIWKDSLHCSRRRERNNILKSILQLLQKLVL